MNVTKPWQTTPSELIKQAIAFLHQYKENARQIGFLLLDVGVETLFKTFLLLPETTTKVSMNYTTRENATKGKFHNLVEAIKEAGRDRLKGIDLDEVQYYHDIRNKLYHQGDGVTPTTQNAERYASIAIDLLYRLLSVDLRPLLLEDQAISELINRRKEIAERELEPIQKKLREQSQNLYSNLVKQLEGEESEFGKHSFLNGMGAYIDKFNQPEIRRWKSAVKRFLSDGLYIMDDDGNPVMYCETDEVYWDFVNEILEKNPVGYPPPPLDKDYLDRIVDINEYGYLEIIMADDLTEALLLITNHISGISQTTTVEDYCKIRNIFTWDVDSRILDDDFENELQSIVEEGKQLLAIIS